MKTWTVHARVSPCWSRDSLDQTGPVWQPAPGRYPHRNTGKPDQTLPGPGASPAATSSERWGLKKKKSNVLSNQQNVFSLGHSVYSSSRSTLTLMRDRTLLGTEPALSVDQLPAPQALLAAVERAARGHQSEQVSLGTANPRKCSTACGRAGRGRLSLTSQPRNMADKCR